MGGAGGCFIIVIVGLWAEQFIDFGDLVYSHTVNGLAIAAAYAVSRRLMSSPTTAAPSHPEPWATTSSTASCSGAVDSSEQSQGISPISDECYACVNNTSCQIIETSCASACADLSDRDDQTPEPDPGESN